MILRILKIFRNMTSFIFHVVYYVKRTVRYKLYIIMYLLEHIKKQKFAIYNTHRDSISQLFLGTSIRKLF